MKKKIIIICISVILFLAIGISAFIIVSNNNKESLINEVKTLLEKDNFDKAKEIISKNDLLNEKAKEQTLKIISTRMTKYKVSSLDNFINLTNEDWENIKKFDTFINDLKLKDVSKKYEYFTKLIELEEYNQYIPAIKWIDSTDYEVWQSYIKLEVESDFTRVANMLPNYSFEKYGVENVYIKDLNEEKDKFAQYCKTISEAILESNLSKYNSVYDKITASVTLLANTEIKILTTKSELENKIKELPTI